MMVDPSRSEGSWVYDKLHDRKLLDCYTQFASQPLGWNHPILKEAIYHLGQAAMHKIANSDMYCDDYEEFVKNFAEATPDFKYHFFVDGGTMAVENALKTAFDYKMKKLGEKNDFIANSLDVIHLERAFHGRSGYCLSLTNTIPIKVWGFPKFHWTRICNPCFDITGTKDLRRKTEISLIQAEEAMKKGNVAALIVEPIQGEGGDLHFPASYLQDLRNLCNRHDVIFIADEVQTGLGLTGKLWAYEHLGFLPDIISFGKKTQVCGIACTAKVDEVEDNVFRQSSRINSTWGGNIVDMVRFSYIWKAIRSEKLVENAAEVGEYFFNRLESNGFMNVRGRGLMIAFDLQSKKERDEFHARLASKMLALKSGDRSIRLRPPLTFSRADADAALNFLQEAKT